MAADGTAEGSATYPTVYGFWTNKGGVGKTTLTFHMATTYAKLFPQKAVVVIDMSPDASVSSTLLTKTQESLGVRVPGDRIVAQMREETVAGNRIPKTIGGYFITKVNASRDASDAGIPPANYLVRSSEYNPHVPGNIWLVCGDPSLDLLAPRLTSIASIVPNATGNAFKDVHCYLKRFIEGLRDHFVDRELVVFIDTTSSFSIYTQIALCAMTQLVIPISDDTSSRAQAIDNMYHLVYGLYPTTGRAQDFEKESFAHKARRYGVSLPRIAAIIHWRHRNPTMKPDKPNERDTEATSKATIAEQIASLYNGFVEASEQNELERVFKTITGSDGAPGVCGTQEKFECAYMAAIQDMKCCGMVATGKGYPLWVCAEKCKAGDQQFEGCGFREGLQGVIKDMMTAMRVLLGDAWIDPAAEEVAEAGPARARRPAVLKAIPLIVCVLVSVTLWFCLYGCDNKPELADSARPVCTAIKKIIF